MKSTWQDSVAVVTGASRGLGAAIATGLAGRGLRVALLARSTNALEAVAQRIRASGGTAWPCPADLTNWDAVGATFAGILQQWGRIDVLVNAAGTKVEGAVESATHAAAQAALDVNYLGALACCRAVLPEMRRRGSGHILNISSVLGRRATPQRGLYAASKAALNALTDALRLEVADAGVHVTLVCPGRLADGATEPRALAQSVQTSAARILDCLDRPRRELVLTLAARALVWGGMLAPVWLDRMLLWWRHRERHIDEPRSVGRTACQEDVR